MLSRLASRLLFRSHPRPIVHPCRDASLLTAWVRCFTSKRTSAAKASSRSVPKAVTSVPSLAMKQSSPKGSKRRPRITRPPKPILDTLPYPNLLELPEIPTRGTANEAAQQREWTFPTHDEANCYIDRLVNLAKLSPPVLTSGVNRDDYGIFRAALTLEIPEELLCEEFQSIQAVVGVGESRLMKDARIIARRDLAERLYRVLATPLDYVRERAKLADASELTHYIPVSLSAGLCKELKDTCDWFSDSGVFHFSPEEDEDERGASILSRDDPLHRRSTRKFATLPDSVIRKLCPPSREASRLPIATLFQDLIRSIDRNSITILSAATGSGKTTQLPQYILDAYGHCRSFYERPPSVLVTQPRRIAAKSVAQRVADERERMGEGLGRAVGYSVRFDSKPPTNVADGAIVFCTAGILLRRLQREPDLASITHLILDEVHERDVFTDVLLLVVRKLLRKRPDLRVILMSATLEAKKFVDYFEQAGYSVGTVLDIDGTNHPVTEYYLRDILRETGAKIDAMSLETQGFISAEIKGDAALTDFDESSKEIIIRDRELQEIPFDLMAELIDDIVEKEPDGAILTFLPGWEEITELHQMLSSRFDPSRVEFHLLHSTAPAGSAEAAFRRPSPGVRKIILATNIAESSVTIPDVVYVLDSGKQKVMHYDQKLRMNVLEPCWISRANLRQRLGRAGRCQPGKYFGFFEAKRVERLPDQTLPELLRLGLDDVCLNLKAMGLTESSVRLLSTAIDPPERMAVKAALTRLKCIGAIDEDEMLTPLGRVLANIPINPGMGKMLITALIFGCLGPVLTTVAMLGQKIFRPARLPHEKYDLHAFYRCFGGGLESDHLLTHRIYKQWKSARNFGPDLQPHEMLLSRPGLRRLDEARSQILRELQTHFGMLEGDGHPDVNSDNEALVRLILTSGFYPDVGIGKKTKRNVYELKMVRRAMLATTSINAVLGKTVIESTLEQRGGGGGGGRHPRRSSRERRHSVGDDVRAAGRTLGPQFVIYEDLIDVGAKMLVKTTAVDPLCFILFASRLTIEEYEDAQGRERFKQLLVDDWLHFRAEPASNHTHLLLLSELRLHWNDFVQFVIYKQLRREPLNEEERTAVERMRNIILLLCKETRTDRQLLRDTSKECDDSEMEESDDDDPAACRKLEHLHQ